MMHRPASDYDGTDTITAAIDVQAHFVAELLAKRSAAIAANNRDDLRVVERVLQEVALYQTFISMRVVN